MENNSKNLLAVAYLSGVGEAFKKAKILPQYELETYIEDAKSLRRQFINRSKNDGYDNPIQIIENIKQAVTNELPNSFNVKPSVIIPNSRNFNVLSTPSIISNSTNVSALRNLSAITPVSTNISAVSPLTNVSAMTPVSTNIPVLTPLSTNVSSLTPVSPLSPIIETPKVNNAIANLSGITPINAAPAPVPAPAPAAASFFSGFHLGGKRKMRKTKKSNKRKNKNKKTKRHSRR